VQLCYPELGDVSVWLRAALHRCYQELLATGLAANPPPEASCRPGTPGLLETVVAGRPLYPVFA